MTGPIPAPEDRWSRLAIVAAILALVIRLFLLISAPNSSEDFFITLRFAENIAAGHGFVYNVGTSPVLGTTTPLYTLLLALALKLHLNAILIGKLVNVGADSFACVGIWRLGRAAGRSGEGALAAIWLAINPIALTWADSGMESTLTAAVGIWVWALWAERRTVEAWAAAGLLLLLRIDGVLLIAFMALACLVRDRRVPLRGIALFALIVAPWLIWATVTFGSPIPTSVIAKLTVYGYQFPETFPHLGEFVRVMLSTPENALMLVGMSIFAIGLIGRSRRSDDVTLAAPFVWAVVDLAGIALSKPPLFGWYLVPPLAICLLTAVAGWSRVAGRFKRPIPAPLAWGALSIVVAGTVVHVGAKRREAQAEEERLRVPIGRWLRANARPTDTVMLEPIGCIGYYGGMRVLDTVGLVSPEVLPFYRTDQLAPLHAIWTRYEPDWVLLRAGEKRALDAYEAGLPATDRLTTAYRLERVWMDASNRRTLFYLYRIVRRTAFRRERLATSRT